PVSFLPKETDRHGLRKNRSLSHRDDASTPQPAQRCERRSYKTRLRAGNSRPGHFGGTRRDKWFHIWRAISRRSGSTTVRSRRVRRRDRTSPHKMVETWCVAPLTYVKPKSNNYG